MIVEHGRYDGFLIYQAVLLIILNLNLQII